MKLSIKDKHKSFSPQPENGQSVCAKISYYITLLPQFLVLLLNLLRDARVSSTDKAILMASVAYVLNPIDFILDWIPFAGLVDDLYLVALSLLRLVLGVDEQVLKDNWRGSDDLIPLLRKVADTGVAFLPAPIRRSIFAKVDRQKLLGGYRP